MNFDNENFNTKVRSPCVFVPNKSGHDFSASLKYGPSIYVTEGLINRFSVGYMARKWHKALKESTSEDCILITSLTILTVIGAALFGHLHGRINLLIFRNNSYIKRTIVFDNLKEEENDKEDCE